MIKVFVCVIAETGNLIVYLTLIFTISSIFRLERGVILAFICMSTKKSEKSLVITSVLISCQAFFLKLSGNLFCYIGFLFRVISL